MGDIELTQSLLQRWLREYMKIMVWCVPTRKGYHDEILWNYYTINYSQDNELVASDVALSYEEALEEGLKKGLELRDIVPVR